MMKAVNWALAALTVVIWTAAIWLWVVVLRHVWR